MKNIIKTVLLAGAISLSSCNGGYNNTKSGIEEKTAKDSTEILNEVDEQYKDYHKLTLENIIKKEIEISTILNKTEDIFDKYKIKDEDEKEIKLGNYTYHLRHQHDALGIVITNKNGITKEYYVDRINIKQPKDLHLRLRKENDNGIDSINRDRIDVFTRNNGTKGYIQKLHYTQEGTGENEKNINTIQRDFDILYNEILRSLEPLE